MSDRMALMDLYECTLGVRWRNSSHWTSERSSRHWFGVTVDVAGRVCGLDLSGNLLQGGIHDCKSFGRLTHLESLCLESNGIQGPIPSSIGTLTSLLELNLSWNQLEGNIPPSLYDLGRLRVLRLDNNRLTGALSPALGRLSELRLLDVSNNALCGDVPSVVHQLAHLQVVDLSGNKFDREAST